MKIRLWSFIGLVAAVLLSDIVGSLIGDIVEAVFKAGVLALLIWLVRTKGSGSQISQKPSSGSLRGLWRSSSEQVIDYETKTPDPAKRRPY